jgi:hypothetical protein
MTFVRADLPQSLGRRHTEAMLLGVTELREVINPTAKSIDGTPLDQL